MIPKTNNVSLFTGGVKAGKSTVTLHFALSAYRRAHLAWRIRRACLGWLFKKVRDAEEPLFYSNIPLAMDYVPLTEELVLRKKRFAYGSVIFIDECSLLADSMDYKDDNKNDALRLFNKLIAHETKGGQIFYNTQAIKDCHMSIKRCISTYFYVHHMIKWIPFFVVAYVREMYYSDDDATVSNAFDSNVEDTMKRIILPKTVWKKMDCFCYSKMTDDLEVEKTLVRGRKLRDLKTSDYIHLKRSVK